MIRALLSFCLLAGSVAHAASRVSVAAAANFIHAFDALNAGFARTAPDVTVDVTIGASGSLFAQIKNGAPFDVFVSADTTYPEQAIAARLADPATLRIFATGRLVLWTTRTDLDVADIPGVVRSSVTRKIALAQPRTAPYGRAAQAALERLDVWKIAQPKIVIGESIAQTAQFIETGNADAGFVALSLVLSPPLVNKGRWHEVPPELYDRVSLDHAAVLTLRGTRNPAAQRYLEFLQSPAAREILRRFGYRVP